MRDPTGEVFRIAAIAALASERVFDALVDGPATPEELAARLKLDADALRRALEVARAQGFVAREGDRFFYPEVPFAGAIELLLGLARMLPDHLRSGRSLTTTLRDRERLYQKVTPELARMTSDYARVLAEELASLPAAEILDVGAGSGVWSLAMAEGHEGCVVTALDLPPVLERFREAAGPGHKTIGGDYLEVDVEPRYDRVILGNILHLERPERARRLLERAAGWRADGGRVIIVDTMFRDDESAASVASYELHLALRVDGGRVYSHEELTAWAQELGLEVEGVHRIAPTRGAGAMVLR